MNPLDNSDLKVQIASRSVRFRTDQEKIVDDFVHGYRPKAKLHEVHGPFDDPLDDPLEDLRLLTPPLERNRIAEIAVLVRALTYSEMMEFAEQLWANCYHDCSAITEESLPRVLHRWATSPKKDQPASPQQSDRAA